MKQERIFYYSEKQSNLNNGYYIAKTKNGLIFKYTSTILDELSSQCPYIDKKMKYKGYIKELKIKWYCLNQKKEINIYDNKIVMSFGENIKIYKYLKHIGDITPINRIFNEDGISIHRILIEEQKKIDELNKNKI